MRFVVFAPESVVLSLLNLGSTRATFMFDGIPGMPSMGGVFGELRGADSTFLCLQQLTTLSAFELRVATSLRDHDEM